MATDRFHEAMATLRDFTGADAGLTAPVLDVVAVTGAAICTMGFLGTETVAASDPLAARLDELQFDLGEGPCWDALTSGRPVLEPDLRAVRAGQWPALLAALADQRIGAVFAFPLTVGPLRMGAMDLYDASARHLDEREQEQAAALAAAVGRHVLRRALRAIDEEEPSVDRNPFSRRRFHQATGYVVAQLGVPAADAELLIQGRAFAEGRTVSAVSEAILAGDVGFAVDVDRIEDDR